MVENVIYKSGSFTDWLGVEHPFVVAGVVDHTEGELILASCESVAEGKVVLPVIEYNDDGHIRRSLFIGVAICNPKDIKEHRYNEEIGKKIAYNKALSKKLAQRWVATNIPGMLTEDVVKCILDQEAAFVAAHPEAFIKGYLESKAQYERRQQAEKEFAGLPAPEQVVVKTLAEGTVDFGKLIGIADALGGEVPAAKVNATKQAPTKRG